LRAEAGLTLAELAARANTHLRGLAKLESGARQPQWPTVLDLAGALGVQVTAFLPVDEPPARKARKK
jgi:transcriptional regulator with XRE-family HTH domain